MTLERGLPLILWRQLKSYYPYYFGALLSLFFTHYVGSYLPFYAKELAEIVSSGAESIKIYPFFLLAIGILIFRTSSRLLFFFPARIMERDMRVEILERLETLPPSRYEKYPHGQLFQVVYTDVEHMRALVGFAFLQVGNIIVALSVLTPKLVGFNSELSMAILPMLFSSLLFAVIVGRTRHFHRKAADMQGEVQNYIMESYVGKKTIKNYHSEKSFVDFFRMRSLKELHFAFRAGFFISFAIPLVPLGVGFSFLWGAHIIQTAELGASSLILFSGFAFLFLEPLMFLSWIGVVFSSSFAAWGRIKELIRDLEKKSVKEIRLNRDNPILVEEDGAINFNVLFWEKNISLDIIRNSWTVFIGRTGCGKTEVLYQIAEILKLRGLEVAMVSQTPYLYNDTISGNIFLGREPTEEMEDKAYRLLDVFGLCYLAKNKRSLLEMEVGENGKRLSGGQQKRLGLVRSLLAPSEILLWDDPFSSIDVILEREIINKLKREKELVSKTIILCSHRASTVKKCDYIIYLDDRIGISEQGTTENLLFGTESKTYEFFKKQFI